MDRDSDVAGIFPHRGVVGRIGDGNILVLARDFLLGLYSKLRFAAGTVWISCTSIGSASGVGSSENTVLPSASTER
ncbi:MAG: hypothetical protein MI673_10855 [Thiotrichales bacterium]|nr:hypothetical protein [Thiotrichales bacterium]